MNHMRLQSALKNYADKKSLPKDELIELLNADDKAYTSDEVVEIVAALENYVDPNAAGNTPGPDQNNENKPDQPQAPSNANKKYEEWKVKPVYKDILDNFDKVVGRKLTGFEKDAQKAIRTTCISPDKAELLNSQSENSLLRLYEAE